MQVSDKEFLIRSYVETIFSNIDETNEISIEVLSKANQRGIETFTFAVAKNKLIDLLNNCPSDIVEIAIYSNNELINKIEIAKIITFKN